MITSPVAPPRSFAEWLTKPMFANTSTYVKVGIAAAVINIFGLSVSLFSMTVYDRVVPNNAIPSLVGLTIGLAIVATFDFVLRMLRAYFVDVAGADVDRRIGKVAFERLLTMQLDAKRGSTGVIAGTMRELETLRDFLASATLTAMIDVPFIMLTLLLIGIIGGWLVVVPILVIPFVIGAGVLTFPAMDRLSSGAMAHALSKQSVLIETIGGIETVKATGGGRVLGRRWLQAIDDASDSGLRQRLLGSISVNVANFAQTASYAGIIVVGVLMIAERHLTMGSMIACSLLSSRAVAPLATIAQLLSRLSATRTSYRQLNSFMMQASEIPAGEAIRPTALQGKIEFRNVSFRYPGAAEDALKSINITIQPGERVALLGKVGSGKSTLARLALGLYRQQDGLVLIDNTDIRQMDLQHMRGMVGSALQESVLLTGTVRDNITLDRPGIDDAEMQRAAKLSGADEFLGRIVNSYDLVLTDRGESLSGGQRQSIALARALAGQPKILIFDEPTSAMDGESETALLNRLAVEVEGKTMLLITHRMSLLRIATRVIILNNGVIVADGPRDQIVQKIAGPRAA